MLNLLKTDHEINDDMGPTKLWWLQLSRQKIMNTFFNAD